MEIFLGILPWDEKIFSISMFSPMGSVWGSLEVLIGALKLFTACSMFCFGKQMVQLEVIFLELLYDANVMEIGTDNPLYICYMVECKLRQLWTALRTQLTVNGAVVVLGNMGWVTYLRNVLHKVVLDATRIIQFDRNVRPTLPEVFLNPFSQGGNQMGNEVLDDEYDHNRRNVTHISSSRTSTSTRGPNTASEDNRKRSRSVLLVEDQKPRITHGYSSEKRPSHGRIISTTKERPASSICIRYAVLCLKGLRPCPFW